MHQKFLGIETHHLSSGLLLSQQRYIWKLSQFLLPWPLLIIFPSLMVMLLMMQPCISV
jgi:hypothetical protein